MTREEDRRRAALVLAARRAYRRGLQTGDGGNLSARSTVAGAMLVTGSGTSFGDCEPDDFLTVRLDGTVVGDVGRPTREALMHARIYAERADVGAVVHAHAPYTVALSHRAEKIPRATLHARLKIPAPIVVLDVPSPFVREQDWPLVGELLARDDHPTAFVLRDHGLVTLGPDPVRAEHLAELVEETAQVAFLTALLHPGAAGPIPS
ncbi:MAG TPA: class II aldolase/adducin family protein [Cellulomonas sp.]